MNYKLCTIIALFASCVARAADFSERYNEQHPLVIVGDWDKPPYEFLNDDGEPAGMNIDLMTTLCKQLDIPCRFILKEWSGAMKTFERGDADIILANGRRYQKKPYVCSQNIINYNRVCVATRAADSVAKISYNTLVSEDVVIKPGDFTGTYFRNLDSLGISHIEYQSPKVALQGVLAGDYKYFCWGEEPLKWKINNLHLNGITICEADIPVSEIHIIGRDPELIFMFDDLYARLKGSGEVQRINDKGLLPERVQEEWVPPMLLYIVIGALIAATILYFFGRLARHHVKAATRNSTELKDMMFRALKMGNLHIMEYDIKHDLMTNRYGAPILPQQGTTLKEFTGHIHPREQEAFKHKMEALLSGRERKFELKKRWRAYQEGEHWLNLDGHAIVENDKNGMPSTVINAIHDLTLDEEKDRETYETECKYHALCSIPSLAIAFYNKDGQLHDTPSAVDGSPFDTSLIPTVVDGSPIDTHRTAHRAGPKEPIHACMMMKNNETGQSRGIEYHVQPLLDNNGDITNYCATIIDLTSTRQQHVQLLKLNRETAQTTSKIKQQKDWLTYLLHNSDRYIMRSDMARQEISFYREPDSTVSGGFAAGTDRPVREKVTTDNIADAVTVYQWDDFCNNHLVEADSAPFRKLLADDQTKDPQQVIIHLKEAPGTISVYQETFHPVFDDNGHITGHEGISADLTRLMNARQQLEQLTAKANDSVRLKGEFMASITHELRTPLNAIIGFTSVINNLNDAHEREEYIRIIQNSSDMMQRLLNDITQASSINDEHSTLEYSKVNFPRVFDDICLTLQQRVQKPVRFIKENKYDNLLVNIDVGRVQQIITNFVTNAVKFTKKGHIRLGYRHENDGLYIFCEDTGLGIPEDKQGDIFQRFVKLNEFVQGTGMGLAISKSIVEHMGGTIGVTSKGIGHGSTFWFHIPA